MRNLALIQARLGSSRLPGKVLKDLCGKPLIQRVYEGTQRSKKIDKIIVCIPKGEKDLSLKNFCIQQGYEYFAGDENDVLNRFYEAANLFKPDNIIRVCADNPLVDGYYIDSLIDFFEENDCDYSFNHIPYKENNWPDGLGAEIFKKKVLDRLQMTLKKDSPHREHVTSYIWSNKEKFRFKVFHNKVNLRDLNKLKLDIDTFEDFEKLNYIISNIRMSDFDFLKIVEVYSKFSK